MATLSHRMSQSCCVVVLALGLLGMGGCLPEEDIRPDFVDQTLDLSKWEFNVNPKIWLGGEWLFSSQMKALPAEVTWEALEAQMTERVEIPWREGDAADGTGLR